MNLNATSYFAGIGTVVAALIVGFGGALLIVGPSQQNENRNRVQQVMAHTHNSAIAPEVRTENVLATHDTPPPPAQPTVIYPPSQEAPQSVTKLVEASTAAPKPDVQRSSNQDTDNRAKLRAVEVKVAVDRENQRKWADRKKRQQEIDAATASVKRMLRDNRDRQIVQVENSGPAGMGFFGN